LLKRGGVFLFAEPACAQTPFASPFDNWRATQAQAYDPTTWGHFWARANELLGSDHREQLVRRPAGREEIGDYGIPVLEYVALLERAGMQKIDILFRDAEKVVLASVRP